jgi:hypothetical protein
MVPAAAAALSFVCAPHTAEAQEQMTFRFQSFYKYRVQVKLYSQSRPAHEWPGGGDAYGLDDDESYDIELSCQRGERICFGAWVTGTGAHYWGAGDDGRAGCTDCCYTCDGGETPLITLR